MHVGIILDGNRRYATAKNKPVWMGHRLGAKKVEELIEWAKESGVDELTLYAFSIENFNRDKKEVEKIFDLFRMNLEKLKKSDPKDNVRIRFVGRLASFPKDMRLGMRTIMQKTKSYRSLTLNLAMAYGGRAEIVDAVTSIVRKAKKGTLKKITEQTITDHLYLQSEPDLIIRPGGEKRVSNFLLWQGYYSEWYFTKTLWPEFTKKEFIKALSEFKNRQRRFGE